VTKHESTPTPAVQTKEGQAASQPDGRLGNVLPKPGAWKVRLTRSSPRGNHALRLSRERRGFGSKRASSWRVALRFWRVDLPDVAIALRG
jgi:hypothetical protein